MRSLIFAQLCVCASFLTLQHTVTAHEPSSLNVRFSDCVESIGVGLVSTDAARSLVPCDFPLVGEGSPVTPIVVRTARCRGISVAGRRPRSGVIVQIGMVIVPPDFTGDINNYTLWYYTSDATLADHLRCIGVDAQHVAGLDYDYQSISRGDPAGFLVNVPRPAHPTLSLFGTVVKSELPAGSFTANWWASSRGRTVKMTTSVPSIFIGSADIALETKASSSLGRLIGGGSTGFPVLQQFNTFTSAEMQVVSVNE